jgi:uncharacterized protein (TIGR02391 family)
MRSLAILHTLCGGLAASTTQAAAERDRLETLLVLLDGLARGAVGEVGARGHTCYGLLINRVWDLTGSMRGPRWTTPRPPRASPGSWPPASPSHAEVLRYCEEELLRKSLFHAVFQATKGVSERLRQMSGLTSDGAELVDQCFGARSGQPLLQINGYRTDSETSEQRGFANLLKGLFGTFRNPPAHTPRATAGWALTEPDALDLFSTLSLVHRRLDTAEAGTRS